MPALYEYYDGQTVRYSGYVHCPSCHNKHNDRDQYYCKICSTRFSTVLEDYDKENTND